MTLNADFLAYFATRTTLSKTTFIWSMVPAVLASLIIAPQASLIERTQWLGLGVLGLLPAAGIFAAGARWVERISEPTWRVVVVVLVAWSTRGAVLAGGALAWDLPDTTGVIGRFLGPTITMTLWSLAIGALIEARRQYRRSLETRFATREELQRTFHRLREPIDRQIAVDLNLLDSRIQDLVKADESDSGMDDTTFVGDPSDVVVRPVSHKYWALAERKENWWQWLVAFLRRMARQELNTGAVIALFSAGLLATLPVRMNSIAGVAIAGALTVCLTGTWVLVRLALRVVGWRAPISTLVYFISVPIFIRGFSVASDRVRGVVSGDGLGESALTIGLISTCLVVLAIAAAFAMANKPIEDLDLEAADIQLAIQEELTRKRSRQVSSSLHNDVQSALTAAHLRFSLDGRFEDLADSIQSIRAAVADAAVDTPEDTAQALDRMRVALDAWAGLVRIEAVVDEQALMGDARTGQMASLVKELVANSVRHGQARRVRVELWDSGNGPIARVHDDGQWATSSRRGVGLQMADGDDLEVDRRIGPDGTVVTIRTTG